MPFFTFAISLVFATIHVFAGRLRLIHVVPRSAWLGAAGGVSVAYVFIHLLPEAQEQERRIRESGWMKGETLDSLVSPIFLTALIGVVVFYGLERAVVRSRSGRGAGRGEPSAPEAEGQTPEGIFWLHIGSFALYNALITYLLVRESEMELGQLATYALAMGLHYTVNDFGLQEHHRRLYELRGRWILAAAAPTGWVIGWLTPVHVVATAGLFGFLCGATVLNVLKEELPAERESRFWAFCLGAAFFTAILMLV